MKIKLKDYERIYKTINAILLNENADPTGACTFFSFYGAYILREHYKINAQPVAGLCLYHMGGDDNVLTFGKQENGYLVSDINAFHCWVVGDGWLFDFMAPSFSDIFLSKGISLQSKMIQKPLSSMANSVNDLKKEGDFYFEPDDDVMKNRMGYLSSSLAYSDLADICKQWYKKPPKKMASKIQIGDTKGNLNSVSLTGNSVVGAW